MVKIVLTNLSMRGENEGTERDIEGVGWDMSIPLKLFLVLDGNGNLFRTRPHRVQARSEDLRIDLPVVRTFSKSKMYQIPAASKRDLISVFYRLKKPASSASKRSLI